MLNVIFFSVNVPECCVCLQDKDGFIILVGASFLGIVVRHPHGLPPAYFRFVELVLFL